MIHPRNEYLLENHRKFESKGMGNDTHCKY